MTKFVAYYIAHGQEDEGTYHLASAGQFAAFALNRVRVNSILAQM